MRRFAPRLFAQLFCISSLFLVVTNSYGQIATAPRTPRQEGPSREWSLGNLRRDDETEFTREMLVAQVALKTDFRNLQRINNHLMARVFEGVNGEITNKEIRSSLGELKKLAERLRLNLALPKIKPVETEYDFSVRSGLLLLDKAVMSFVHNPLFKELKVFNAELALRAGKDLSKVLRLSEDLRKLIKPNL